MRVFVSYSIIDSELHLLTLLIEKLRRDGHMVDTSDYYYDQSNDYKIVNSNVLIGIITNNSRSQSEVINEWRVARSRNIQTILLIEEGVRVNSKGLQFIRFSRRNPSDAIAQLFGKSNQSKNEEGLDTSDVLAGVGIIAGIAALIALFSGGKE